MNMGPAWAAFSRQEWKAKSCEVGLILVSFAAPQLSNVIRVAPVRVPVVLIPIKSSGRQNRNNSSSMQEVAIAPRDRIPLESNSK